MTKAACDLVITIIRVSLTWRTVKGLKRTGTKRYGFHNNIDQHEIDWEILQLWALYSFHKIYAYSGAEWFVSCFPFYFYIKLIMLIALGIPGTKFPNFWFEIVLVPLMNHIHVCLNLNWREMVQKEAVLLPWRLLDLFILPGLISDEEAKVVKRIRDEQLREALKGDCVPREDNILEDADGEFKENINVIPNREESPRLIRKQLEPLSTNSPGRSPVKSKGQRKSASIKSSSFTSPVARSRVAASSLHLRKFSRDHHLPVSESTKSKSRPTPENPMQLPKIHDTVKYPSSTNLSTPKSKATRTTRKIKERIDDKDDGSIATKSSRRPPTVAFKRPSKSSRKEHQFSKRENDANSAVADFDDDMSISSRRSVGSGMRRFITGDDNIRIRDFLFDLELPSIPSPKRMSHGADDSSATTRTSNASKKRRSGISEDRRKSLEEWKKEREARRGKGTRSKGNGDASVSKNSRTRDLRPKPELPETKGTSVRRSSRIASKLDSK
jgi:hypothetical protein